MVVESFYYSQPKLALEIHIQYNLAHEYHESVGYANKKYSLSSG